MQMIGGLHAKKSSSKNSSSSEQQSITAIYRKYDKRSGILPRIEGLGMEWYWEWHGIGWR
jgi:hypothetical protein